MFSKEESKRLRQDFWIAFGKSYPQKWILYNTKVKGLAFKFSFDTKKAMVSMDVEHTDLEKRIELWEKLTSLKSILVENYLPELSYEDCYILDNQKEISRIYIEKKGVSIHNKNTWQETMIFFHSIMPQFEAFFLEFKEIISA